MDNMNQSNMMDPSSVYGLPPCSGPGCASSSAQATVITPTSGNPNLPTLEDIANYNYLSTQGQQMQHKQLQDASNKELDKIRQSSYPSPKSYTPGNQGLFPAIPIRIQTALWTNWFPNPALLMRCSQLPLPRSRLL